jgi:hypothetical protein
MRSSGVINTKPALKATVLPQGEGGPSDLASAFDLVVLWRLGRGIWIALSQVGRPAGVKLFGVVKTFFRQPPFTVDARLLGSLLGAIGFAVACLQGLAVALVTVGPSYFDIQVSVPDQRFYLIGVAGNLIPGLVVGIAGMAMRSGAHWGQPMAGLGLAVAFGAHFASVVLGGVVTFELILLAAIALSGVALAISRYSAPVQPVRPAPSAAAHEPPGDSPAAPQVGSAGLPRAPRSRNGKAPAARGRRAPAPPKA